MSDGMITKRLSKRILDTDRRLDIYPGLVKAPAYFFEKYGTRFSDDIKGVSRPGAPPPTVRVIESWAEKSRAAEAADVRKAARLAAKKEAEAASAAAAVEGTDSSQDEQPEDEVETEAGEKEVVEDSKLLPPEKAIWTGAKKLGKKKKA